MRLIAILLLSAATLYAEGSKSVYRENLPFVYSMVKVSDAKGNVVLDPQSTHPVPVVSVIITLDCAWNQSLSIPAPPAVGSVQMELAIDGDPTGDYFSGPPCAHKLDTTTLLDGPHSLAWWMIDSTGATYSADQMRSYSDLIMVMNHGPLGGPQILPVTGNRHGSMIDVGTDFVQYPGHPTTTASFPYPYTFVPPNSAQPRNTNNWFVEGLNETRNKTYAGDPGLYTTRSGGAIMRIFAPDVGSNAVSAYTNGIEFHQNYDGPRGDNRVSPYSTFVEAPDGSAWVGVDIAGRVFRLDHFGAATTIAGPQPLRSVLQYDFRDKKITDDQLAEKTKFIGTGDTATWSPTDLCFDPRDANILYLADSQDHRILKIDLAQDPPVYTNYAGRLRTPGHADGPSQTATFNRPFSLVMAGDGTMYVSDFMNGAIRAISPDGSTVTTLLGNQQPQPPMRTVVANKDKYASPTPVPFSSAYITYPQAIRFDSRGNLVLVENSTQAVRLINLATKTVSRVAMSPGANFLEAWTWLDVDSAGSIGPKDDILVMIPVGGFQAKGGGPSSSDLWTVWRISEDGAYVGAMHWNGSQNAGYAPQVEQAVNHYPWAVAISRHEGRFITAGFSNDGISSFHILQPKDVTTPMDVTKFTHGMQMFHVGTIVPGFKIGMRPSFSILSGWTGGGHSGIIPSVDQLHALYPPPINCTDLAQESALAGFIQSGYGGSVPRPEITGNDLRDLIYFLRRSSMQDGELNPVKPCPDQKDVAPPVISNVVAVRTGETTAGVTFTTNEATLGFVAFGSTVNYSGSSDIETGYSTAHTIFLHDLPTAMPLHFAVVAKDKAGNRSNSVDIIL